MTNPNTGELIATLERRIRNMGKGTAFPVLREEAVQLIAALRSGQEAEERLAAVDSFCGDIWRDGMGAMYDGDNESIWRAACERLCASDPEFKRDYEAHEAFSHTARQQEGK